MFLNNIEFSNNLYIYMERGEIFIIMVYYKV